MRNIYFIFNSKKLNVSDFVHFVSPYSSGSQFHPTTQSVRCRRFVFYLLLQIMQKSCKVFFYVDFHGSFWMFDRCVLTALAIKAIQRLASFFSFVNELEFRLTGTVTFQRRIIQKQNSNRRLWWFINCFIHNTYGTKSNRINMVS